MNINTIIDKVVLYYEKKPYDFYQECFEYLRSNFTKDMIIKDNWSIKNYNNSFILEAIRIYFLDKNFNDYMIIVDNKPENSDLEYIFTNKLYITKKQLINLLVQLDFIENADYNSSMFDLCKIDTKKFKIDKMTIKNNIPYGLDKKIDDYNYKEQECYEIYISIIKKQTKIEAYKLNYQNLNMFCGIDYYRFLYYHNLERFCQIYNIKNKYTDSACDIFESYYKVYNKLSIEDQDNIYIFSGVCLHALGSTYTTDIDLMVIASTKNLSYKEHINKELKYVKTVDYTMLLNDKQWHKAKNILAYQKNWLTYELPILSGAKDIYEVYSDPKFHFNFLGMKFVSLNITLQKLYSRNYAPSYTDLIALNTYANYPIRDLCIPNMTIFTGKITVYHDSNLEVLYKNILKWLYLWYNIKYSMNDIKKKIKRCNESSFNIYSGALVSSTDTDAIKIFHIALKDYFIKKYASGVNKLLDIGSGHLKDLEFWIKNKVKTVVGIEPSVDSIKRGIRRINKIKPFPYNFNINVVEGVGNEKWKDNKKYVKVISNKKYNCITFMFTIHYMLDNYDILMENINNVIEDGGFVVILLLDGDKIINDINKSKDKYIKIVYNGDVIFYIENVTKSQNKVINGIDEIFVYFKGTYGMSKGSFEYLANITELSNKFTNSGYSLLEKIHLSDIDIPERKNVASIQLEVSSYYMALIYKKN